LAGGQVEHAGFGGLPTKPSEDVSWFGPQNQVRRPNTTETGSGRVGRFEVEDTWRDCMACVGRTRGAAKAWPSDRKTHKHYINAPAWVVSPVVELGVVESFPTLAGPDI
jgi:hypothetical protein